MSSISLAMQKKLRENAELFQAAASRRNKAKEAISSTSKKVWEPHPKNKPQLEAYFSSADRLFYGGRAGGGKSDLILGLAFTAHRNSIIFRREYPQLKGLIRRSRQIGTGVGARFNGTEKSWSNIPGNRELEFGAVQYEDDVEKYQGRDHDLLAFDEITHFSRYMLDYLSGWNRSAEKEQRCRIVCTGNPPTSPEGLWVIHYWGAWLDPNNELFNKVRHGELVWYVTYTDSSGQLIDKVIQVGGERPSSIEIETKDGIQSFIAHSRTFIPASLDDNPYLSEGNYKSVLQAMPLELKRALLEGIFTMSFEDDPWQVIPSEWVELAFKRGDEQKTPSCELTSIGVDVARGGKDETIFAKKYGSWYAPLIVFPGSATPDGPMVAAQVVQHSTAKAEVNIDVVGVGSSAYDSANGACNAYPISGGESSEKVDQAGNIAFFNKRSEIIWKMREALDPANNSNIAFQRDSKLKADLCSFRWKFKAPTERQSKMYTSNGQGIKGQIQVEDKEETKKRVGRSPDRGDAVCYANYERPVTGSFTQTRASWA
jgi:hypothetical protein